MDTTPIPKDILQNWDVLVVDDDLMSLEIAQLMLAHYGANVHLAYDGEEGLKQARALHPRFIISDLSMPKVSGWDLIKQLQDDRATLDIPVIALTAHAMVGDREKAIAAGFHNYLSKPLTPSTFMRDLLALLVNIPKFAAELNIGSQPQ
jgi:two-component system, cell cycle response regulator DivK